jgi:carbon monoxide dehydrogenase subunit G
MAKITCTTQIAAPVSRVFALSSDIANWTKYIKGIKRVEMLTGGPMRVGTRFKETRLMYGREATEEMTVTAIEHDRSYTLEAKSCGCHYVSTLQFEPDGERTKLTMSFEGRPLTFMAKLFTPLSWLMTGMLRKCIQEDLDCLKVQAERGDAQGA